MDTGNENDIATIEHKTKSGWSHQSAEHLKEKGIVPEFDLKGIRKLCCGPYALRLAIPYYRHAKKIKYMMHKEKHAYTIRCDGVISRHSRNNANRRSYKVYHRFDANGDFLATKSYCTCGVGSRTVCLCAHMTASLYILYHRLRGIPIPEQTPRISKYTNITDLFYYKEA